MSSFYSALCTHYDKIFPLDEHQTAFVETRLQGCSRILEVGAATGNLALYLSGSGAEVTGVDLNEDMIRVAVRKSEDRPHARFSMVDMRRLRSVFEAGTFDAVVCVGNTLVHLPDLFAVGDVLSDLYTLFVPHGRLILQIVNYDRIFSKCLTGLPPVDNAHVTFERRYHFRKNSVLIDFETTLTVKSTGEVLTQSTRLFPVKQDELLTALSHLGFRDIECFGSFRGEPFDISQSIQLVVTCIR